MLIGIGEEMEQDAQLSNACHVDSSEWFWGLHLLNSSSGTVKKEIDAEKHLM